VPLTPALAQALAYAEELARGYHLLPVPPGLLALALVAEPGSGGKLAADEDVEVAVGVVVAPFDGPMPEVGELVWDGVKSERLRDGLRPHRAGHHESRDQAYNRIPGR
jgi:hypothetical protein